MKPMVEVADIFRSLGDAYRTKHAQTLSNGQRRVMGAIEACRTAVLGGHVEQCADCGKTRIAQINVMISNACLRMARPASALVTARPVASV